MWRCMLVRADLNARLVHDRFDLPAMLEPSDGDDRDGTDAMEGSVVHKVNASMEGSVARNVSAMYELARFNPFVAIPQFYTEIG